MNALILLERLLIPHHIGRIRARRANRESADNLRPIDELEIVHQMVDRVLDQLFLGHLPDVVAEGAEVLDHQRREIVTGHHVRAPVLRLMETSEENALVMHVEPGIGRHLLSLQHHVDRDDVAERE